MTHWIRNLISADSGKSLDAARILTMAMIYFVTGKFIFSTSSGTLDNLVVSIVLFIPEGFALAGAILYGQKIWPGIFLGQLLLALSASMPLFPAIGISVINSLEAILAATLFRHFQLDKSMGHIRDVTGLLLLIALVLQPFSAVLGNLVLLFTSVISWQEYPASLFSWWFGNTMGQLLFTPMLLLIHANRENIRLREITLLILFFALLTAFLFNGGYIHSLAILLSITLPLVMLVSFYKNTTYATIATTTLTLMAIYATNLGAEAFNNRDAINNAIDLNFYILSHIFLVLIMGTLFCEKKQAEQQLIQKNIELEKAATLRELVERMTQHDLKNPLNTLISIPDFIQQTETDLSSKSRELLHASKECAYNMLDMINRSLDMYKMEVGTYQLHAEKVDLIAVLQQVLKESGFRFQDNDYPIKLDHRPLQATDHLWIRGEQLLCYSLFSNLVRNALEASPDRETLTILARLDNDNQRCIIELTNQGSVPEEIRDRFFDKLVTAGKKSGAGLGTYSARLCTETMHGEIALDSSQPGQTRIILHLPAWSESRQTTNQHSNECKI
jgi:signal transduction histidine kinase